VGWSLLLWCGLCLALAVSPGCQVFLAPHIPVPITTPEPAPESGVPRELAKVSLPPYTLAPPDILLIGVLKIVPKPPHYIETFDVLNVDVQGTLPVQPIAGPVQVGPDGRVDLGPSYGKIKVIGLSIDEARTAISRHLALILQEPNVSVALLSAAGAQQIGGQHLMQPDGTVNLGRYGSVYLAGLTVEEAEEAIEKQLAQWLDSPEVIVDIFAYNSKAYYLITSGGGLGDNVLRLPVTGNETVLDAISLAGGLSQLSSKRIWIARPAPNGVGCEQILLVNWDEITRGASTATNYQLMPGDRLFIAGDSFLVMDNQISKITQPFQRLLGLNILGVQMVSRFKRITQVNRNFF
jgi:protein involved in polysaccharide export with SLBB domain